MACVTWRGLFAIVLFGACATTNAQTTIFRNGDELVVSFERLDRLRQEHATLVGEIRLSGPKGNKTFSVDLANPVTPESLIVDVAKFGVVNKVEVDIKSDAGKTLAATRASPVPVVAGSIHVPVQAKAFSAIERGKALDPNDNPKIAFPVMTELRHHVLDTPARSISLEAITFPVVSDVELPGLGSTNCILVSRQSFAPSDASKCSLYFSYRQPLFDSDGTRLKEWRKMLVEVPIENRWRERPGDEVIELPPNGFAVHTTEEKELEGRRWDAPDGYNMLGRSSTGLFQGGQTVDVDDEGRIYVSNVSDGAGVVRFNPHRGRFEQPPLNVFAELERFLPAGGDWKRSWDKDLALIVLTRGRVFLVFDRNYRVVSPNGRFETCSGVVSLPQQHWDDAAKFRREMRLHAACWPTAEFPLYSDEPAVGAPRRLGAPQATTQGIAFGKFRLDLDDEGRTSRLAEVKSLADSVDSKGRELPVARPMLVRGLSKQRSINVGAAGRPLVRQAYGELKISRAGLGLIAPDAPTDKLTDSQGNFRTSDPGALDGELTVRFDINAKIRNEPHRFPSLATSLAGISQGPAYAAIAVPDEPDCAIAVCDYNYFVSKLDFSRREQEGKVFKSYLTQPNGGRKSGFPITAGLGPYNSTWVEHDGARWLYFAGYTGMSRLKYSENGKRLEGFSTDVFHARLSPRPLDGVARESVKDYLHILPTLGGRLIDIGRGRVGRGGGAYSAGLEIFDPKTLGASQTSVFLNRCYGLFTPVHRLVFDPTNDEFRQEIFAASGTIRPEYLADIDDVALRPANHDPKIFTYACATDGRLRDLFGFSLPPLANDRDNSSNLAFSPCRQYLVALQGGDRLLTYDVGRRRFIDGLQLSSADGKPVHTLEFSRPSATIWTAPNGQIFFHAAFEGEQAKRVSFFEVEVARDGRLRVNPHLTIAWDKGASVKEFSDIVRCFLPDLTRRDGSYDLVLGSISENGGQPNVRVIPDFIPAAK